jgi:hypothetical protein
MTQMKTIMAGDGRINPIPAGRKEIDELPAGLAIIFDDKNTRRSRHDFDPTLSDQALTYHKAGSEN